MSIKKNIFLFFDHSKNPTFHNSISTSQQTKNNRHLITHYSIFPAFHHSIRNVSILVLMEEWKSNFEFWIFNFELFLFKLKNVLMYQINYNSIIHISIIPIFHNSKIPSIHRSKPKVTVASFPIFPPFQHSIIPCAMFQSLF